MQNIKISVIIPVYNAEKYIRKCLDSIINQTFKDFEVICVDDCSNDNSLNILKEYEKKDNRIKVIAFSENKKQGAARNTGLDCAKGQYITFVDADDYIDTQTLEKMFEVSKNNSCDLIITDIENFTTNETNELALLKTELDSHYKSVKYNEGFYSYDFNNFQKLRTGPVAKLYKKSIIDKNHIRFPENIFREDEAFYWFIMPYIKNLYYINEPLYKRLVHIDSTLYNIKYTEQDNYLNLRIIKIIYKYLKSKKIYNKHKNIFMRYVSNILDGQDNNIKTTYYLKIFLFMPEIIKLFIKELIIELKLLKKILFNKHQIAFWGASIYIENFLKKYRLKSSKIIGIIDKNSLKQGKKILNIPIIAPEEINNLDNLDIILTIKINSKNIYPQIKNYVDNLDKNITLLPNIFDK